MQGLLRAALNRSGLRKPALVTIVNRDREVATRFKHALRGIDVKFDLEFVGAGAKAFAESYADVTPAAL